jgi:hypothetical protein
VTVSRTSSVNSCGQVVCVVKSSSAPGSSFYDNCPPYILGVIRELTRTLDIQPDYSSRHNSYALQSRCLRCFLKSVSLKDSYSMSPSLLGLAYLSVRIIIYNLEVILKVMF